MLCGAVPQEYINDYGNEEMKAVGREVIERELGTGLTENAEVRLPCPPARPPVCKPPGVAPAEGQLVAARSRVTCLSCLPARVPTCLPACLRACTALCVWPIERWPRGAG
jgi:hypothetical protein